MIARIKSPSGRTPKPGNAGPRSGGRLQRALDATAKREIGAALREASGNLAETARKLGVSYKGLWKRLRSLQIDPDRFRR
jgi:DNA-binding NtrC family response regulator